MDQEQMTSLNSRFKLERDPLSEETKEFARKDIRETPELVAESCEKLRELMKNCRRKDSGEKLYFPEDEEFLLIFLRPCKFYPESALELMIRVADFKEKHDNVVGKSLTPDAEQESMTQHGVVNVLVDRDQNGRRILVAHIGGAWNTKEVTGDQIFRLFYLIHIAAMLEPETQARGTVVILDFENLSMRQVAQLTPNFSLRLLSFIQDAMPLRLKEVHIVKQPYIFNIVWNVFKPFIREKLKKRLVFHGTKMKSLHEFLNPDFIPEDYGGKKPKIDYSSKDWYPVIKSLEDKVLAWHNYGWQKE